MPVERTQSEHRLPLVKERNDNHVTLPLTGLHRHALETHNVCDMASCTAMYDGHRQHVMRALPGHLPGTDGPDTLIGTTTKLLNAMSPPAQLTLDFSKCVNALSVRYKELGDAREREADVYQQARLLLRRGEQGRPEGEHLLESMAVSYEAAAVVTDERLALLMLRNRLEDMLGHVALRINSVEAAYRHARLINYACGLRVEEATGVRLPTVARGPSLTRKKIAGHAVNPIPVAPAHPPPQAMVGASAPAPAIHTGDRETLDDDQGAAVGDSA
jgi:hypothetical protein